MNISKSISILMAVTVSAMLYAQTPRIPQRNELATVESEIAGLTERLEVFDAPDDSLHHYWLSVGHLGFGDAVVQIIFDPIFELFIPLGGTVAEALETLEGMKDLFNEDPDTGIETKGCLAFGFPSEEKLEKVNVTFRKVLFSKFLEFGVEREGYVRSTHIGKGDFKSLVFGVKIYHKLHPKE